METIDKRCQVHLIESKDISNILVRDKDLLFWHKNFNPVGLLESGWKYHNLYITSDDEIKEGDWCLHQGVIKQAIEKEIVLFANSQKVPKIIVTTDKSLGHDEDYHGVKTSEEDKKAYHISLSQPSNEFIQEFIKEYNNGNIIKEVLVECEYIPGGNGVRNFETPYVKEGFGLQIKINPEGNTVNIKLIPFEKDLKISIIELIKKWEEDFKVEKRLKDSSDNERYQFARDCYAIQLMICTEELKQLLK